MASADPKHIRPKSNNGLAAKKTTASHQGTRLVIMLNFIWTKFGCLIYFTICRIKIELNSCVTFKLGIISEVVKIYAQLIRHRIFKRTDKHALHFFWAKY